MVPNPVLRKLGFGDGERVAVIHTDDIGMCQASLSALADLVDFGLISSASTMVPCSWFPQVATFCRQRPQVDMGVHLTLTSEMTSYRWGPISTRDPASGLIDEEGYFYQRSEDAQDHGDPAAVRLELQVQVERALAAGIDVTHVDTHMGTVAHPRFVSAYIEVALRHHLPSMALRLDEAGWRARGMEDETATLLASSTRQLEAQGLPLFDWFVMLPLDQPADRVELAKRAFDALPPGLTHFAIHPSQDTPELRAIAADWPSRVADYRAFTSGELRDYIRGRGIRVIGYRALRDLMPSLG